MNHTIDILFTRTWWNYSDDDQGLSDLYHWFNLFEGCVWLIFSGLVLVRYRRHFKSRLEVAYAVAFFAFALTDFREAWVQQSWLLWIKLIVLIALFRLRRTVMRDDYPDARVY